MSIARFVSTVALTIAACAASAHPPVTVPSDPLSWDRQILGLPDGTERCPGGEFADFLKQVPQLEPQSPSQYEAVHRESLSYLLGLEQSDTLYPFYFHKDLLGGTFFGIGGFFLVRGDCIIHVQPTVFDN